MIDIHCHILPSVDDGAQSVEESMAMARYAVKDGIHTIIATPHALGGTYPNPPEKVKKGVAQLREYFKSENIPLSIYPGSEAHLCPDLAKCILKGETAFLCENNRYVLVEFPFQSIPQLFLNELDCLRQHDITPVVAHPERNLLLFHKKQILHDLISMGCLIQVNSTSITGGFGKNVMVCAHDILKMGLVHIIASDAHSATHRPPALSQAVKIAEKILENHDEAMAMVDETPKKILTGDPIEIPINLSTK